MQKTVPCVWDDPRTQRRVWQLTNLKDGARTGYFRLPRNVADRTILIHADGGLRMMNVVSEEPFYGVAPPGAGYLKLYRNTPRRRPRFHGGPQARLRQAVDWALDPASEPLARLWLQRGREIWVAGLFAGLPGVSLELAARLPDDVPGAIEDITCDGQTVILLEHQQDLAKHPLPTTKSVKRFWSFINRPRRGRLCAYHIPTRKTTLLVETDGVCPSHVDCSPGDPTLVRYCLDMYDAYGQRIWTVRTDGSKRRMIRPQERGEFVTHEFWWSDPDLIGYTYQDRRGDRTIEKRPWGEYSPCPTRLGVARVRDGKEIYLSEPLNCYHSHLFVSPDGKWVCGEGTDGHSFVYAAPFSFKNRRIEMTAYATIHTRYVPFRGQNVDAGFTDDSKWLVFTDTVDGRLQVCACKLDGRR
jgi:hypothetical protein